MTFRGANMPSQLQFKSVDRAMQLTKENHFDEHEFHDNLLLSDVPSPQHPHFPAKHVTLPVDEHISTSLLTGQENNQLRFYQEFKKIYTVSHHLTIEKRRQVTLVEALNKRIKTVEERMKETLQRKNVSKEQISEENRTKRSRRTAEEIEKKYKCEVACCERLYGSEGSLQQHIKLKHPELYHRSQSDESPFLNEGDSSL